MLLRGRARTFEWALLITLPLASGFALGTIGCADPDDSGCTVGSFGCTCFPGNVCLAGLSCLSGLCLQLGGEGETGDGDGSGDTGDGDGDTGPGDGDPGDGDPGDGDGDGDGDPGDGDGDGDPGSPCDGTPVVLYSQTELSEGYGIPSNTLLDYASATIQAADDFVIPQDESCWCITGINAQGFYRDGVVPAIPPNVNIEFYNDGNSVPTGAPIFSESLLPPVDDDGNFEVALPGEVLSAGTYWLSIHPDMEFAETIWYWQLGTNLEGDPTATRDVDGIAYEGLCTVWTPTSACFDPPPDPYEFAVQFDIIGVIGGDACN
jgi:hypothetical protein